MKARLGETHRKAVPWLLFVAVVISLAATLATTVLSERSADDAASAPAPAPTSYREATWQELVPADWNPIKRFERENVNRLNDSDPRADALLDEMRALWDNAPTVAALDGADLRLPGYVVPLQETAAGLTEFLLVPYFGACIHTPPPPANQIVLVVAAVPVKGLQAMDVVNVSGRMSAVRADSPLGSSGYRLAARRVEHYKPPP